MTDDLTIDLRGEIAVLRGGGSCVVIELRTSTPTVVHWGRDVPDHAIGSLTESAVGSILNSAPDGPRNFPLLATEASGWSGPPSVAAHRGGRTALLRWELKEARAGSSAEGSDVMRLTWADGSSDAVLTMRLEVTPEGLLQSDLQLTSSADAPTLYVERLHSVMPVPTTAVERRDFAGTWSGERRPQIGPIAFGTHSREVRRGRPGHDAPTLLVAQETGASFRSGSMWGMHVAWSGDQHWMLTRLPEGAGVGGAVLAGGELLRPGEVRLAAGESYHAPTVYFAWSNCGLDLLSDRFHEMQRRRHPVPSRPVTLNSWEAVYFDHNFDRLSELVDRAASVGVERFVLDDGWFIGRRDDTAGLGDWAEDPEVWPEGLTPLVDRVRERGMQFGLWFEPEMVNPNSRLAREHPDWLLIPENSATVAWRHQQVLDLGRPEVREHMFDTISTLVDRYDIDYIKWDHNRDLHAAVSRGSDRDRPGVHRHTRGLYDILSRLRDRHRDLQIESCASGGARIDLGIAALTDRVWASDTNDPVERLLIQRGTEALLAPERIGSHVGSRRSHTTARETDLATRFGAALLAWPGIEWDLTTCDDEELAALRRFIEVAQSFRDVVATGKRVHADLADPQTMLTGSVSPDRERAVFVWARLGTSPTAESGRVAFPGLDYEAQYCVRVVDGIGLPSFHHLAPPPWVRDALAEGWLVSGLVLSDIGVPLPTLNPGQILVLEVRRTQ